MKTRLISFLLILISVATVVNATCDETTYLATDYIYTMPDVEASFPDGVEALDSIIRSRLSIPDSILAPIKEIHGVVKARCIVRCVIETDGSIGETLIEKTTTAALFDNEALRVVKSLPPFISARTFDMPVRSWMLIPVEFVYDFSQKD